MPPTIQRTASYPYRNWQTVLLCLSDIKQFPQSLITQGAQEPDWPKTANLGSQATDIQMTQAHDHE